MRDKLILHQLVLFVLLAVLVVYKLVFGGFTIGVYLLWWLLGAMVGFLFVFSDRFVYSFLMKPEEALAMRLKELFGERRLKEGLVTLLNERHEQKELPMRSVLFLLVWQVLAFMTITSVPSPFARGLVLGIGTHLIFDLVYDYFWNNERFNAWFWQIKREVSAQEKRWFVMIVGILFLMFVFSF